MARVYLQHTVHHVLKVLGDDVREENLYSIPESLFIVFVKAFVICVCRESQFESWSSTRHNEKDASCSK